MNIISTRKILSNVLLPFTKTYQTIRPGIRILMYHRVNKLGKYDQLTVHPSSFDEHMAFLSEDHRVISLDQAIINLESGKIKDPVVVTFDDGYLDNFTNALPVLCKYNIPATFFVTTKFCDQTDRHPRYSDEKDRLHLTWDEVKELVSDPNFTIGSHTISHPYLSRVSKEKSRQEIVESRIQFQDKLGIDIDYFCYPSGDYGIRELKFVMQGGYKAAVTTTPGSNHNFAKPFELTRTEITDKDDITDLKAKLNGAFDPIHVVLSWKRQFKFAKTT